MTDRCGCEVGDDCTKTTMCAVQAAVEDTREPLIDALDHIMRVCRNTDVQTKRLLWIEKRAECAINGSEDWREYDYPKVRKAAKENGELRERIEQLEAALGELIKSCQAIIDNRHEDLGERDDVEPYLKNRLMIARRSLPAGDSAKTPLAVPVNDGEWYECSECGDELLNITGSEENGTRLECGRCGHQWWEYEYIAPGTDGDNGNG